MLPLNTSTAYLYRHRIRWCYNNHPLGCKMERPAGFEPAPQPWQGRMLTADTTAARAEDEGIEPAQAFRPTALAERMHTLCYLPDKSLAGYFLLRSYRNHRTYRQVMPSGQEEMAEGVGVEPTRA